MHPSFKEGQKIIDERGAAYDAPEERGDPTKVAHFPYLEYSYAHNISQKERRMATQVKMKPAERDMAVLKDSVIDIMNYCAFFYAYLETLENDE